MLIILFIILRILSTTSIPDAAYTLFPGFDFLDASSTTPTTAATSVTTVETTTHTHTTPPGKKFKSMLRLTPTGPLVNLAENNTRSVSPLKLTCPEDEKPSNIGPYEVPTQRDLVLLTIKTLHRMYGNYHRKTMVFLDDISKVVRATEEVEKRCLGNRMDYRQCVKYVTNKCEGITKSITSSLDKQRLDVVAFGDEANTVCSVEAMKADPVKLIKKLASEYASLDFALPGFLKLIESCSAYCNSADQKSIKKSSRQVMDTNVLVKHFLENKDYIRMLKPRKQDLPKFNIPILRFSPRKL